LPFEAMWIMVSCSFITHPCQEIQIKNPFDQILGFGLVKDFWKWNFISLKKENFHKGLSKDSYNKIKLMVKTKTY
jgi:hypothetical protein